jgi:hypothetical protein
MTNPEVDHGMIMDENAFLSLQSPYLNFGWDGNPSIQDYVNRITPEIADEMEFHLGINEHQSQYHINISLHPNLQALQDLTPSRHSDTE